MQTIREYSSALTYDGGKPHAANKRGGVDRYDYDANGNMTLRNKGLSTAQTLTWDHENRLASLTGGGVSASYLYDDSGRRVKKVSNGATWYYPFPQYEIRVTSGVAAAELAPGDPLTLTVPVSETQAAMAQVYLPHVGTASSADAAAVNATTVTKYYLFNGQRIAMTVNGSFRYLHADHLGSTVLTTLATAARESERGYYAFGSDRRVVGTPATDHRFTGQKQDGTGLYYYNARYYDPVIGQFISPDTLVPEPGQVFGYNRYMYTFGNPLNFNDPSGHCKMLADGGRDTEGDKACWDTAFAIYGYGHTEQSFAEDWNVSPDAWLQNIASQEFATVEYLRPFHDKYAQEFRWRTGLQTAVPGSHSEPPQHPLEATVEYCREHDCVTHGLNAVGSTTSVVVLVLCVANAPVCATTATVGTTVGIVTSGASLAMTGAAVHNGTATEQDLLVATGTFVVGASGPFARPFHRLISPSMSAGASLVQTIWNRRSIETDVHYE